MVQAIALSALLELAKEAGKPENAEAAISAVNDTTSIAARARKSMLTYPVIFSPGLGDYNLAFQITKYLELQYAMFTMLTAGASPKTDKNNVYDQLSALGGGESLEPNCKFVLNNWDKQKSEEYFNIFLSNNPNYFDSYQHIKSEETAPSDPKDTQSDKNQQAKISIVDLKLQKAIPTVVELQFFLKDGAKVNVPIAIKAHPHFIALNELCSLVEAAIEDKRILNRFIKLTSGEISFFKDFLFGLDKAKRDEELYLRFGKHPWYQQFLKNKSMNLLKRIGLFLGALKPLVGSLISGTSNFLPMASIICTVDEITTSSKMKYAFLLKNYNQNNSLIKEILNRLALLTIGVYDPVTEICTFFFNGFKEPVTVSINEMSSSSGKDPTSSLIDLMGNMLRRGTI
jgi:hypothetical protein